MSTTLLWISGFVLIALGAGGAAHSAKGGAEPWPTIEFWVSFAVICLGALCWRAA